MTAVELDGTKFYETRRAGYFIASGNRGGDTLQRAVWRKAHGNIPHGWHVHHRPDTLKSTTDANDLVCLPAPAHFRMHRERNMAQTCLRLRAPKDFVCQRCGLAGAEGGPMIFVLRDGRLVEKRQSQAWESRGEFPTPMLSRMDPFESPVSGREISTWRERDRDMAAAGAVDPRDLPKPTRGRAAQLKEANNG